MSFFRIKSKLENVREVTVVIYLDKTRNPSAGILGWLENFRDLSFNGQVEIWQRRELRSPEKCVKWREVRFGNLSNRRGRNRRVASEIVRENRRRLVIERNCFETAERGSR
jgi:hypothetical protein